MSSETSRKQEEQAKEPERKKKPGTYSRNIRRIAFAAVAIALATCMSMLKLMDFPMGGSLTLCSMFFITVIGYWFGFRTGIITAVAYGLLQLIINPYVISPLQLLVDYFFAFGALGLSGLFRKMKGGLWIGYWVSVTGRFVFAFLSGMIFFGSAAADYNMAIPVYSAVYNGSYLLAEGIITTVVICIPPVNKALARVKNMALAQQKALKDADKKDATA